MKNSALIILVSCVLLGSCMKPSTNSNKKLDQISLITISRTPCFGTCPIYTLQIDKHCVATLEAVDHLPNGLKGRYETNLPEKEWMKLIKKLEQMNYSSLEDTYGNRQISDLPSVISSISYEDGDMKKIDDYGARGNQELSELYAYIDALIGTLDWESTDGNQ
ncbi:DUF6438 domain-containing protein [Sphingobacterium sp. lm-10]|uniref:DUF6438 domain-containing protein n=1 Tax=Sphingobacterium sp. lm-10 TaxID=2944904 RepID=UPI002021D685|nr:DUF6438 domain-containing protein [Sphingobacterium sp. lm-10]MCL7986971.1 DUF6438 domain-containing protein [Sphingobacterium sp. lm-10]